MYCVYGLCWIGMNKVRREKSIVSVTMPFVKLGVCRSRFSLTHHIIVLPYLPAITLLLKNNTQLISELC